jgi:hypothetical protein
MHNPESPHYSGLYVGQEGLNGIYVTTLCESNIWGLGDKPIENQRLPLVISYGEK